MAENNKKDFFYVAEEINNETIFFKVPNELRGLLDTFKNKEEWANNATLMNFREKAAEWFKDFPGGLELLQNIKEHLKYDEMKIKINGYEVIHLN